MGKRDQVKHIAWACLMYIAREGAERGAARSPPGGGGGRLCSLRGRVVTTRLPGPLAIGGLLFVMFLWRQCLLGRSLVRVGTGCIYSWEYCHSIVYFLLVEFPLG